MKFLRLYLRVLELLGREARLGWVLAIADLGLAFAIFVEPILFGRIVDTLADSQGHISDLSWPLLLTLVGAWTGFGLFTIAGGALVALHADRLAHRQRQVVMTNYFEHVLQLLLSHHERLPFRAPDEGDADRNQCAVGAVALVFSGEPLPPSYR